MLPSLPSKKLPQKRKKNGPKVMPSHPKLGPMGHSPASQLHHSCLGGVTLKASSLVLLESSICIKWVPSREPTYPTGGKGKSSSKVPFWGDMLVPRRVIAGKEHRLNKNHQQQLDPTISDNFQEVAPRTKDFGVFFNSTVAICENTWCNSQISTFITI